MAAAPSDTHEEIPVSIYENERYYPLRGWTSSLLPTDRFNWSSADGKHKLGKDFPLPRGFTWKGDWKVTVDNHTDPEGWEYALDFTSSFSKESKALMCVRRRIWTRCMTGSSNASHNFTADEIIDKVADKNVPPVPWMRDSETSKCLKCGTGFGFFAAKRHHCRLCGKIFCSKCTMTSSRYAGDQLACLDCIAAAEKREKKEEEDREIMRSQEETMTLIAQTQLDEQSARKKIETDMYADLIEARKKEDHRYKRENAEKIQREKEEAERQKQVEAKLKAKQAEIEKLTKEQEMKGANLDHWAAKGSAPRSGSLEMTVERAQNISPGSWAAKMLSEDKGLNTTVTCQWTVDGHTFSKTSDPPVPGANPSYGFTCYNNVDNDTYPIIILIHNHAGLATLGRSVLVAQRGFCLRGNYPNLIRSVSKEGVYIERGAAILDLFADDENDPDHVLKDSSVTISWKLEAREAVQTTTCCPDCGRLDEICECTPQEIQERREKEAKKLAAEMAAVEAAKNKRMKEESEKRAAAEKIWRAEMEEKLKRDTAELEVKRSGDYVAITVDQRRGRDQIDKSFREEYHKLRMKQEEAMVREANLTMTLAWMQKNDNVLRAARFDTWTAVIAMRKEDKRNAAAVAAAAVATNAARKEETKMEKAQNKKESEHEREEAERKYQEEGKEREGRTTTRGGPQAVRVHDTDIENKNTREAVETQKEDAKKKEGGCCLVS